MADPSDPYDLSGVFDTYFGKQPKKPEKGLPWAAKEIEGKLYVHLEQVVELLQQNDVLPAVRRGLERHLNEKKEK